MYHFEKKILKNLEIFERKKWVFFWKKSLGSLMPLVQSFFFLLFGWKFFSFLGKIWKVHQMLHGFLEFKETWNKQTNFKFNHDVANQMLSEAKLGHLLLLGPFKAWCAWTLIMIFWYLLEMAWPYTWKACIL